MKKLISSVLFVLVVIALIFFLSSQPYHVQTLKPLLEKILPHQWITDNFSWVSFNYGSGEVSIQSLGVSYFIEFFIRKTAHVFIFGLLAIGIYALAKRWCSRVISFLIAVGLTGAYAAIDEYHQHLTGDRTPMWQDVALDISGACLGVAICLAFEMVRKKVHRKNPTID